MHDNSNLPDNFLESIPEEQREVVAQMMFAQMARFETTPEAILAGKMTSEHFTMFLDGAKENARLEHEDRKSRRNLILLISIVLALTFLALVFMLRDNAPFLEKIVGHLVSLAVGAFGGFGVGVYQRKKNSD